MSAKGEERFYWCKFRRPYERTNYTGQAMSAKGEEKITGTSYEDPRRGKLSGTSHEDPKRGKLLWYKPRGPK